MYFTSLFTCKVYFEVMRLSLKKEITPLKTEPLISALKGPAVCQGAESIKPTCTPADQIPLQPVPSQTLKHHCLCAAQMTDM